MLSKFLNTKTLIVLLVLLVGIFLVTKLTEKEDRTFKSQLVEIDTASVSQMKILPKLGGDDNEIVFTRTGGEWKMESAGKVYKPDANSIKNILTELIKMKTERVAATDKSKWKDLEVTDSTAARIQVLDGSKVLADVYLGKFSYTQPPQQNPYQQRQQARMFTNIRLVGDENVYVVEGFIKMNIQPNVDSYRAKTLCQTNKDDITKVSFNYPGLDNFTLTKENEHWMLNGQPADSTKTARYIQKLQRLTSSNYADGIEPLSSTPSHMVVIEGNNILPVELKAFPVADTLHHTVITSSRVPDTQYSGEKNKLFERVFVNRSEFFDQGMQQ
ncbi:MAG: DUF4340 domain-containing protein [Bacteroidales bacterium]|nr:DUF4340 domain-containing protein [Bacteroidales bacterium]MCF8404862.1 DUF4340 domain-containing protein [Bacteroidales bacterium]